MENINQYEEGTSFERFNMKLFEIFEGALKRAVFALAIYFTKIYRS